MKFLWVDKLKAGLENVVKEHICSITIFLAATIVWMITGERYWGVFFMDDFLSFLKYFLYGISAGALLCESINLYKRYTGKKAITVYGIIMVVSIIFSYIYASSGTIHKAFVKELSSDGNYIYETITEVIICYLVAVIGFSIYFMYKKSGETFETYCAKAFCGSMKALLVYSIISFGVLMILFIFNELIIDTSSINLIERCEILIVGLVAYPSVLMGLTKTEGNFSKFAKAVLSYIFTGLLALAFLIIYVYIIKILVSWQFPKNQVFAILTAVFCCGLPIWTMAAGVCNEKILLPIKVMPFLFIPFIVLQAMCLQMRVAEYGFTRSRYFGLALIVFEVAYFVMYLISFLLSRKITSSLIFMVIAAVLLVLVVPGTNYKSAILLSQKHKIEKYLSMAGEAGKLEKKQAFEAYKTIKSEGGYAGYKYLSRCLTDEQVKELQDSTGNSIPASDNFYIYADNRVDSLDVEGYKTIYFVDYSIEDFEAEYFPIYDNDGNEIGTVDIENMITKLQKLEEEGQGRYSDAATEVISEKLRISTGGDFVITYLNISGDYEYETPITEINITGYVLK